MKGKIINENDFVNSFKLIKKAISMLMYVNMYAFNHSLRTSRGKYVYKLRLHAIAITQSVSVKNNDINLITSMYCEYMKLRHKKKMYQFEPVY